MRVQVWDYKKEYSELKPKIIAAVDEVFSSGQLILGEHVAAFEKNFSAYCGASYGVGVNSGTDALFLSLKAMVVGAGDEVITVPNTAVPTVSAIVSSGATPVFIDVNEDNYLMDVTKIRSAITPKTKCILPVHLYGQCVDMDAVINYAQSYGLMVLEDCAQSAGAIYKGRKAGSLGDASAHSFYPTKNLGAYGDGGMIVTSNEELSTHLRSLRMYGMQGSYYAGEHGYNSRLDEVQAAILSLKLDYLDKWVLRRREIAQTYEQRLKGTGLILPQESPGNRHSYYIYVVRHPERARILDGLKAKNIFCNISYPFPIHTMPAYVNFGYKLSDMPVTERMAQEIFSLPMYPTLSEEEQLYVCDCLVEMCR